MSSISLPLLGLGLLALIAAITARAIGIDLGERRVNWRLAWAVVVTVSAFLVLLLWPHEESTFLPGANLAWTIASVVPALTFARPRSRTGWLVIIIPVAAVSMRPWSLPDTTDWLPGLCIEVQTLFFIVGLVRGALFAQDARLTEGSTATRAASEVI